MGEADIRVWQMRPVDQPHWHDWLTDGARRRHESYRQRADRDRFLTGTAMLRSIYGQELGVEPEDVPLQRACPDCDRPHGKASVAGSTLHTSISHSGEWVVLAATRVGPVGVDLEQVGAAAGGQELAHTSLVPAEQTALAESTDRAASFTSMWVRKEAVLKAIGTGLRIPMTDLEVSGPGEPVRFVRWLRDDRNEPIQLRDIQVGQHCRASVAVVSAEPLGAVSLTELSPDDLTNGRLG